MPATSTEPCIHGVDDPMWCSTCRSTLGFRPGVDRHRSDCTVVTVAELTGATYTEALALLAAAGRKPGQGAQVVAVHTALREVGYEVGNTPLDIAGALRSGQSFHVSARRGSRGHSFAIVDGKAINALGYDSNVRYRIWAVR